MCQHKEVREVGLYRELQVVCHDWNVKCEETRGGWWGGEGRGGRSDHVGILTLS